MGEFSLSRSKEIKMRIRMSVFELYSHFRLEMGWGGRDQGPEEQMGGTLSLRTHGSLHSCEVDELSGEGKVLLFADNWQHRDSGPKTSGKQCSAPKGQLLRPK